MSDIAVAALLAATVLVASMISVEIGAFSRGVRYRASAAVSSGK